MSSEEDGEVEPEGRSSGKAGTSKARPRSDKAVKYVELSSEEESVVATGKGKGRQTQKAAAANPPPLPPCTRCILGNQTCHPRGYKKACVSCRTARQSCSHAKLNPADVVQPDTRNPPPPPTPSATAAPYSVQNKRKREAESSKPSKVRRITFKLGRAPPKGEHRDEEAGPSKKQEVIPSKAKVESPPPEALNFCKCPHF